MFPFSAWSLYRTSALKLPHYMQPLAPPCAPFHPNYRSAYASWRVHYADVHGPMLTRALAAWNKLESWLKVHSPRILASLNAGATAADVAAAETALGHPLPTAMRVIYRWVTFRLEVSLEIST
jgi:hypothetical protein